MFYLFWTPQSSWWSQWLLWWSLQWSTTPFLSSWSANSSSYCIVLWTIIVNYHHPALPFIAMRFLFLVCFSTLQDDDNHDYDDHDDVTDDGDHHHFIAIGFPSLVCRSVQRWFMLISPDTRLSTGSFSGMMMMMMMMMMMIIKNPHPTLKLYKPRHPQRQQ